MAHSPCMPEASCSGATSTHGIFAECQLPLDVTDFLQQTNNPLQSAACIPPYPHNRLPSVEEGQSLMPARSPA
eukprot:1140557-Pelagomonas_calceolata.AAC.8